MTMREFLGLPPKNPAEKLTSYGEFKRDAARGCGCIILGPIIIVLGIALLLLLLALLGNACGG